MKIYVDEDSSGGLLLNLLRKAGHDVQSASGAGLLARSDPVHFAIAIHEGRACLTPNYGDYEELHALILEAHGSHPGILVVRQDNDPSRDMTPKGIAAAIRRIETAGMSLANEHVVLNHWR